MSRIPSLAVMFSICFIACRTAETQEKPDTADSILHVENLVAWCIVPFDAKKRGPAERAEMVKRLGLKRIAYDWRAKDIPFFEEEILEYKKRGLEFFAFWSWHDEMIPLVRKHNIHPQFWIMLPNLEGESRDEKLASATKTLMPMLTKTAELGCRLGIYNHGGWGGEPENMVQLCQHLKAEGFGNVGIVYNFHHGHEHISDFPRLLGLMKPHLLCINLNGMNDNAEPKILPIGAGKHEDEMIRAIFASGYTGPIGILDHRNELDSEESLRMNLDGLKQFRLREPGTGKR